MRLLLTRAVEDAARTREKLEALGHGVILSPVFDVVGTGVTWPSGVVDAVLATSGQAFCVPLQGPSAETRRVLPLYLVGTRTAEVARREGFLGAVTVAKNAASLATAFGKVPVAPKRVVYLAGRDRKPDIETALEATGQRFELLEVYEARALKTLSSDAINAFQRAAVDGVLHFSRRSAMLFAAATVKAGLDLRRPAHFCLSEDVAAPLREAGCPTIRIADKPNEADLIAVVGDIQSIGR